MVKQQNTSSKKVTNKEAQKQSAIHKAKSKAKAVADKLAAKKILDENKFLLSETPKEVIVQDESPFPTDKNCNSHDSQKDSFSSTAAKLASQPVQNKVKYTSFHTVRDLL